MAVTYRVLPQHNLVLFTYSAAVGLQESIDIIAAAARDPDHRPFMRQLCDLSAVTSVERNFPALLSMQARILEDLMPKGHEMVVVFLAPGQAGQDMARMAQKSWAGLDVVKVLVVDNRNAARDILGLPATALDDLVGAPS